jgi:hypothetical protein
MFDSGSFSQFGAPGSGPRILSEPQQQILDGVDPHAALQEGRALRLETTLAAICDCEGTPSRHWDIRGFSSRTNHKPATEVDAKIIFAEEPVPASGAPRTRSDGHSRSMQFVDSRTRKISTVDVQTPDGAVPGSLLQQSLGRNVLGNVRRFDRGRDDETVGNTDVTLVAVESFGFAFAPVPHLRIADRYHAIGCDTVCNVRFAIRWLRVEILTDDALE